MGDEAELRAQPPPGAVEELEVIEREGATVELAAGDTGFSVGFNPPRLDGPAAMIRRDGSAFRGGGPTVTAAAVEAIALYRARFALRDQ
jgi:hypothetical protein